MGRRTLAELLHIAAGVVATALLFAGAAWSYPLGREEIAIVGWLTTAVVVAMGIGPLRRAIAADFGRG